MILHEEKIVQKSYICKEDISSLLDFSKNSLIFFTYFNNRSLDVVKTHFYNVIIYYEDLPISYGHLDLDEKGILWLGILVRDNYQGFGFGKRTMELLLDKFKLSSHTTLNLCVNNQNIKAQKLYQFYNFRLVDIDDKNQYYQLKKD